MFYWTKTAQFIMPGTNMAEKIFIDCPLSYSNRFFRT